MKYVCCMHGIRAIIMVFNYTNHFIIIIIYLCVSGSCACGFGTTITSKATKCLSDCALMICFE